MLNKYNEFINESALPNVNIEDTVYDGYRDSYILKFKDLKTKYKIMFRLDYMIPSFNFFDGNSHEEMKLNFEYGDRFRYISSKGTKVDIEK